MYRLFIDGGNETVMRPEVFLRPAFREFGHRAFGLPRLAARAAMQYLRDPLRHGIMESFATLSRSMPAGIFDNAANRHLSQSSVCGTGSHQRFSQAAATSCSWSRPISIPAQRSPLEARGHDHVPISKAVEASSALPGLFRRSTSPVNIMSMARSTRRSMHRWRSTRVWISSCASTRWCPLTQASCAR
jgi:hypothetical protein